MEEEATQEKAAEQIRAERASSARQDAEANQSDEAWKSMRCSDFGNEALPGTAKSMTLFLAVEYLKGWGRDIMDDDVLGDLTAPLKKVLKDNGASMQFIRKPGRAGQFRDERKLYIARTDQGTCFTTRISGVEDLLHLDIQALADGTWGRSELPARPVKRVNHPIMLVCTHGKRDRCCAIKGRPLAAGMQTCFSGDEVWETSHSKGHRFAPTMILLPWGYSYGRIPTGQAIDAVKTSAQGHMYLTGLRGRGCWDAPGQTAEIAVAQQLGAHTVPVGSLVVKETTDQEQEIAEKEIAAHDRTSSRTNSDDRHPKDAHHPKLAWRTVETSRGETWVVQLEQVSAGDVMASCGKPPKHGKTWVAHHVTQV